MNGTNMDQGTFRACMDLVAQNEGCSVTIGGGEPTMHPNAMEFIWQAVRVSLQSSRDVGGALVGIVTNGSIEKRALELALMAEQGLISARLSYDRYHDLSMVSDRVVRAFAKDKKPDYGYGRERDNDLRATNPSEYRITPHGRAVENQMALQDDEQHECCCDGLFIVPNGDVFQCGCRKKKLGNVNMLGSLMDNIAMACNEDGELPCSERQQEYQE
jgi:hypothetical protein